MLVFVYILFVLTSLAAVFFVLIQQPKQSGLSASAGGGGNLLGDRGFEGGLHRITAGLGTAFLVLALLLNFLSR